jgi:hypothetical protein
VPQEPTKVVLTLDRTLSQWNRRRFAARSHWQCSIIPSVVRPKPVIKDFELSNDVGQVLQAEADEMIEALHFDGLHKTLGVGVRVRHPRPDAEDLQTIAGQRAPELPGELRVHVQDEVTTPTRRLTPLS